MKSGIGNGEGTKLNVYLKGTEEHSETGGNTDIYSENTEKKEYRFYCSIELFLRFLEVLISKVIADSSSWNRLNLVFKILVWSGYIPNSIGTVSSTASYQSSWVWVILLKLVLLCCDSCWYLTFFASFFYFQIHDPVTPLVVKWIWGMKKWKWRIGA